MAAAEKYVILDKGKGNIYKIGGGNPGSTLGRNPKISGIAVRRMQSQETAWRKGVLVNSNVNVARKSDGDWEVIYANQTFTDDVRNALLAFLKENDGLPHLNKPKPPGAKSR